MKIDIICAGKIKEKFYTEALSEYVKRLLAYAEMSIIEVRDEPAPEGASDAQTEQIMNTEGERLLQKLPKGAYVIVLDIEGKSLTSEGFSEKLSDLMTAGNSRISFIIGGSLGLCRKVKDRADMRLSFSKMTFPHQLMRVILAEQIYRAFRIMKGEPYHK